MLRELHKELGIRADYAQATGQPRFDEAQELIEVGPNLVGRMQQLMPLAAGQWAAMVAAAAGENVVLLMVSGFRGVDYQATLIRNKIAAGQLIDDILKVNAAPGFSEHHTGRAVDIATPGSRPLTEDFENTAAFRWLQSKAADFGFVMSFPRGNAWGISYEPWHWCWNRQHSAT